MANIAKRIIVGIVKIFKKKGIVAITKRTANIRLTLISNGAKGIIAIYHNIT
jgi:hypothetical protein